MTPRELLDLLEERAVALRTAGIRSLTFEGVSVKFAPLYVAAETPAHAGVARPVDEPDLTDPLNDPMTFGGTMPGYQIPKTRPAEDEEST